MPVSRKFILLLIALFWCSFGHAAQVFFSPSLMDFGGVDVGDSSNIVSMHLSNNGGKLSSCQFSFTGEGSENFLILPEDSTCSLESVAEGESCTLGVQASPLSYGVKQASLKLDCAEDSFEALTSLRMEGLSPDLTVLPNSYDYGSIVVDAESASYSFSVNNFGRGEARECGAPELVGVQAENFNLLETSTCTGQNLGQGETCSIDVSAEPKSSGRKNAQIEMSCAQDNKVVISISAFAPVPMPDLALNPTEMNFGSSVIGQVGASEVFTYSNTGTGPTRVCSAPMLTGRNRYDFQIISDSCMSQDLGPEGGECSVEIAPMPTQVGPRAATLTRTCLIGGTSRTETNALMTQAEVGFVELAMTPDSHDFEQVLLGEVSDEIRFFASNVGNLSTLCEAPTLSGDSSDFDILPSSSCTAGSLGAGGECFIDVAATPGTLGVRQAVVEFNCDDGLLSSSLSAVGVFPSIALTPAAHDFGEVLTTEESAVHTFTFENSGSASATGCGAPVLSGVSPEVYTLSNDTCSTADLLPGETCTVDISGTPILPQTYEAVLERTCSVGGNVTAGLSLQGISPELAVAPESFDFGDVLVSESSSPTLITISNTGTASATGCTQPTLSGPNSDEFAIINDTCQANDLLASSSCSFEVESTPLSTGAKQADVTWTCSVGDSVTSSLNAQAVAPELALNPSQLDFGQVIVNESSSSLSVVISNSGDAQASGCQAPQVVGGDSTDFSVLNTDCATTLDQGQSCQVDLESSPSIEGLRSSSLEYSCTTGGVVQATLEVEGLAPSLAELSIDPVEFDYGMIEVGQSSPLQTFVVANTGNSDALNCSGAIAGADSSDFNIEASTTCQAGTLGAGQSCQIDVIFSPQTANLSKEAQLEFFCDESVSASALLTGRSSDNSFIANDFFYDTTNPVKPYGVFFESDTEVHPQGNEIQTIIWDFGDGTPPVELAFNSQDSFQQIFHFFLFDTPSESYEITKTLVDEFGNTSFYQETITLTKGRAPIPLLNADSFTITAGGTVNFDASMATDPDGSGFMLYGIDYGDGNGEESTTPFFSNQYLSQGVYPVSFGLMTNDHHLRNFDENLMIYVDQPDEGQPPYVNFYTTDLIGTPPLDISVDGSEDSFDLDGTIDRFIYYTEDSLLGRRYVEGPTAQVRYDVPGNYSLKAVGFDNNDIKSVEDNFRQVFVWDETTTPELDFFIENDEGNTNGIFAYALNTETGAFHSDSFVWDFGDGLPAQTGGFVHYFYNETGIYTVTLTARALNGEILTKTKQIEIATDQGAYADFSMDLGNEIQVSDTVVFDPLNSRDLNDSNNPITIYWDFGDGHKVSNSGGLVSNTYDDGPMTVEVEMFVENAPPPTSNGMSLRKTRILNVLDGVGPTPDIQLNVDAADFKVVTFDASGTTAAPGETLNYTWEITEVGEDPLFNSSDTATEVLFGEVVTHTFNTADTHKVVLSVMDSKKNVRRQFSAVNVFPSQAFQEVTPTSHDFGAIIQNQSSSPVSFSIQNVGHLTATNCLAPEITGIDSSQFTISNDTCGTNDLANLETCTLDVTFSPDSLGVKEAVLERVCSTTTALADLDGEGVDQALLSKRQETFQSKNAKRKPTRLERRQKINEQIIRNYHHKNGVQK